MVAALVMFLRATAVLFTNASGEVRKALIHSIVYVLVFLLLYAGYNIVQAKGDLLTGLQNTFAPSKERDRAADAEGYKWRLQYELKAAAQSDKIITQVLSNVLGNSVGAARAELAIVHNGVSGVTGIGLLRYDIVNGVAALGRARSDAAANLPLANWADYSRTLFGGECAWEDVTRLQSAMARSMWQNMNVGHFLACPVIDVQNLTLGAVFISWDDNDPLPDNKQLQAIIAATREQTGKLGAALDLRRPPESE